VLVIVITVTAKHLFAEIAHFHRRVICKNVAIGTNFIVTYLAFHHMILTTAGTKDFVTHFADTNVAIFPTIVAKSFLAHDTTKNTFIEVPIAIIAVSVHRATMTNKDVVAVALALVATKHPKQLHLDVLFVGTTRTAFLHHFAVWLGDAKRIKLRSVLLAITGRYFKSLCQRADLHGRTNGLLVQERRDVLGKDTRG
jgi:hypothetical protein